MGFLITESLTKRGGRHYSRYISKSFRGEASPNYNPAKYLCLRFVLLMQIPTSKEIPKERIISLEKKLVLIIASKFLFREKFMGSSFENILTTL